MLGHEKLRIYNTFLPFVVPQCPARKTNWSGPRFEYNIFMYLTCFCLTRTHLHSNNMVIGWKWHGFVFIGLKCLSSPLNFNPVAVAERGPWTLCTVCLAAQCVFLHGTYWWTLIWWALCAECYIHTIGQRVFPVDI